MLYYVNNKKLVKKDITAVDLVLSLVDKDTSVKLLASSFAKEPTKITGWNKIDHKRNFAVVKFDKQFTDYDVKIIDKNLNDNQYVVFSNGKYDILVMNLDKDLSKDDYKNFVVNTCRGLRVKVLPGISTINKAIKIDKITAKDIISKNKDGKPYPVDAESISNSLNGSKKQEPTKDNTSTDNQKEPALHLVQSDDEAADDSPVKDDKQTSTDKQANTNQTADEPKLYFLQDKKLAHKSTTAVKLIDSVSKSNEKLDIKLLASSFNQDLDKVDGWSKKNPRRNFVILEFDSSNLDKVKQMVKANYKSFSNCILLKTDDKGIFILDLNEDIGKNGYKEFAKVLAKNLGIDANSKMTSLTHLVDIKDITEDNIVSATTDKEAFDIKGMAKNLGYDVASLDPKNNADDKNKGKKAVLTTYYALGRSHKILSAEMSATEVVKANNGQIIRLIGNAFTDENGKDVPAPKSTKDIDKYNIYKSFIAIRFNSKNYEQNIAEALQDYCLKHSNGRYMIVNATKTQDMLIMDLAKAIDSSADYENVVLHFANDSDMKASAIMRNENSIIPFDYNEDNVIYNEGSKPFIITSDLVKRPNQSHSNGFSRDQEDEIVNSEGYGKWYTIDNDKFEFLNIRKTHCYSKSMAEQMHRFKVCGHIYRVAHEGEKNIQNYYVVEILGTQELWCQPYVDINNDSYLNEPAEFYDWNKNIYVLEPAMVNRMIMQIDKTITSSWTKKDLYQSVSDSGAAKAMEYTIMKNHDLIALKNGVYDLKINKFMHYCDVSPEQYCFTRKAGVNYVEGMLDKYKEPTYEPNNWSISKWFTQIATDKNGKVNKAKRYALYQVLLAALIGYCWGKTSIFLIDENIGNTSKSTFLQLIKNILTKSGYASINLVQICGEKSSGMLYRAVGKSAIIGDEMDFSDKRNIIRNSAPFKNLADNGELPIHKYYSNPYSASLNCVFIQAANVFPTFTDSSDSVFDRIYPIMFNHKFNVKKDVVIKNMIKENIKRRDVLEYLVAYILKNIRINHGFVDTGENIDVSEQQQEKQNTVVAFTKNSLCNIRLQAAPTDTISSLYHNYVEGNDFDTRPINSPLLVERLEQKTGWHELKRVRSPFVKLRPKHRGNTVKVIDNVTGASITLKVNETIWAYTLGNMPFYDERGEITNQADVAGGLNDQLADNGLNEYFDQRRGFKTARQLFEVPYVKYDNDENGDIDQSNSGFVSYYGSKKAKYLAIFNKNVLSEAATKPQRLSYGNADKYLLPNPSIDSWQTNWLVNTDVENDCKKQLNRYVEYLKAAIGLNSLTGNKVDLPTTHDIDFVLLNLPKLVLAYYNMHASSEDEANKAIDFMLDNYGDVVTPYVYTLPAVIKDKGAKGVKYNCQKFCQEHDVDKKQEDK